MSFDRNKPFNDLPPLPPYGIELETKPVLKALIETRAALARLNGDARLLPNQSILIQALGLQEAKSSSEIENIVTTNDELYKGFSENSDAIHPNTKEVLRYKDAVWHGYSEIRDNKRLLTTNMFEEIFQIIKQTREGVRKLPGTKLKNPASGEIMYTPPEGEAVVRDKLGQLEQFFYAEIDLDPLVKMALAHYQFEAIHPFSDGNGRTGRILNILYLIDQRLLDIPILYLSKFILKNKSGYYEGLQNITEKGDWQQWILYMLRAVQVTALETNLKIGNIRSLMVETEIKVREQLRKIYSKDLIEVLFQQPYCRIRFLEDADIANRQTAAKYLKALSEIGILTPFSSGRTTYYINQEFLKILTE